MKIFEVNKNIKIVCDYGKTRNGFKHTATLLYKGNECESVKCNYLNRTWESFKFESVLNKLVEKSTKLSDHQKKVVEKYINNGARVEDDLKPLKAVGAIASLGNIFGQTKKEMNDWKARMLKAGLADKGLIMPHDWNELSEGEKEKRLNKVIKHLNA